MTTPNDAGGTSAAGPRLVVLQPCFFPWRGQFDLYSRADVHIFLDDVQFSRGSWLNRNKIMTASGPAWITVPTRKQGSLETLIKDMPIPQADRWQDKILGQIHAAYRKAPFFSTYYPELEAFLRKDWTKVSDLAMASVRWGFERLGRTMEFLVSSQMDVAPEGDPVTRLVRLCQKVGATKYLSGPAAKAYIGEGAPFREAGIELEWMEYPAYPKYRDGGEEMSILDLLFLEGPEAPRFIW